MSVKKENEWKVGLHDNHDFQGGIETMSQTQLNAILDERAYMPNNYQEYLSNDIFHDTGKGCQIEMRISRSYIGGLVVNKYCHTHQKLCSKTGWEMGKYLGKRSLVNDYYNGIEKQVRDTTVLLSKLFKGLAS